MCGIVGYIGNKQVYPLLLNGLRRLEYRGYDSAGIAILNGKTEIYKCKGKVSDLEEFINSKNLNGTIGIGHTRWATHGEPNDVNAHPHKSFKGKFIVIHNGIIENYSLLKHTLVEKGVKFNSETDTEVLANLIEYIYLNEKVNAETAVKIALSKVIGAYGLVIMCEDEPEQLIAARNGSPLVIGIGQNEYFIASDATPIIEHTSSVIYLNDGNIAIIKKGELILKAIEEKPLELKIHQLGLGINEIDKNGFEHFMLKEIFEQSNSINDTFRGRITNNNAEVHLGGLHEVIPQLENAKRIIFAACGTSWHAALLGEYLLEELARIPVEVEYASEFRYRNPVIFKDDIIITISQSGETADSLAAIKLAKESGATVLGICNVVGSSIPRETHAGVYTHAGPEIGVASTKAFTAQVTVLVMMALLLARKKRTIPEERIKKLISELIDVPKKIDEVLSHNEHYKKIASLYKDKTNFLYLGRGYLFPVALEGALKLKEISYIHAEGYPAAEMKHGPIALIDQNMPVVFLATKDKSYEKIVNNIQEVKARKGIVIAIVTKGDKTISKMADHIIEVPECAEEIYPLITIIPLQLLAYHIAVMRGCNVDQPRNLAKSVTVE